MAQIFLSYLADLPFQILVIGKLFEFSLFVPIGCGLIIAAIMVFLAAFLATNYNTTTFSKVIGLLFIIVLLLMLNLFFVKLNLLGILSNMNVKDDGFESKSYINYYLLMIPLFIIVCSPFIGPAFFTKILQIKNI